jgi:methionyl-tRNA formyltransferase
LNARTVIMGYHTLGCLGFDALLRHGYDVAAVFTHRDAPGEEIWWDSLAARAGNRGIPVHYPESMTDPRIQALVASYEPDFLFSFYFRFMLPPEVLVLPRRGALNLHGSLLPRYRGRAPVNWVLVNGETETGVSLHDMVSKPDAGDLVDQEAVAIDFEETPRSLYAKLEKAAVVVLDRSLPLLLAGAAPRRPLDLAKGSYFGGRKPEDGRMDWAWSARRNFFLVRGVTHPYPGAFTFLEGKKLFVWWGKPVELDHHALPGTVLSVGQEGCLVATAQGAFLITHCQLEDGPEQDAYAFCTLYGVLPGMELGSN